jgi:PAS domain S-box-containing protein
MNSTDHFHVLIIEDSPEDRADLRQMLLRGSQRHYRFTEAETGGAGLRAVREKAGAPPDCVLLDFNLPDMNALDVLADLRGAASLPPCPIVVVTGANSGLGADVLRAGAQDYIEKEWITPGSLTRTVDNAAERFALVKARDVAQAALRASEERFRLAAHVAGLAIAEIDYVTDQVHLSPESAALFGLPPQPSFVSHATIHALFHPEDRPTLEKLIAASYDPTGTGEFAMDHRIIRPDGQVRWHSVRKQVFFEQAQPARALLAMFDITARKLRERNLVFLADMQKVFAPLTSSTEIMRAFGEQLTEHLGLVHCTLVEVDEAADTCTVLHDHNAPGTQNLAGNYRQSDFHTEEERRVLTSGAPLVIANVRADGRTASRAEHFEALGIRSLVNAGYVSSGRWKFVLHASRAEPYAWPAEVVELLTELAARIYVRVERARAEEALRDSEEFNRTVLESSPDCLKVIAADGTVLSINENGCSLLRLADPTVLIGKKWWSFWPEESRALVENAVVCAIRGETVRFEREGPITTGEVKWWDVEVSPVRNPDGSVSRIVAVSRDVTERKRADEAVARLAAIVESSHDALFGEDLDGIITSWNSGAEQIFGYRAEEIVGTSIMRLMPADQQAAEQDLQRQIVAGELGGTFETVRRTKEGKEFPASITIAPLKDAAGKVIGTSRVLRDITERTQAEEARRENAELFSSLIAQAPMGTFVVDAQFRIRQVNAEALPAFGSLHPLIGRSYQEVVEILWGPEVSDPILRAFRNTLETGERYISPPFTKQRQDIGIEQTYEWETQRVKLPEGQHGVVCYFHEVTESAQAARNLAEAQRQLLQHSERLEQTVAERTAALRENNEQLESFVYSIAHDLRAPLRAVTGFSQLLLDDHAPKLDELAATYLKRINASSVFMDKLLLDLLAYGRTTSAQMELGPVEVQQAWEAAVYQTASEAETTHARIEVVGLLPVVRAHEATLGQCLANLLSNAMKFVPPGVQPRIKISAEEIAPTTTDGDGAKVRLWVEDNGIGIAPEHQERAFRVFERLNGVRYPGTGIGLSIVRKSIERMGGRVGLESEPGKGSRFWIELVKAI